MTGPTALGSANTTTVSPSCSSSSPLGTITSALIPWNTCGAYMAATLGIATFAYAPFAFFNLLCPVIAIVYGYTHFALKPAEPAAQPIGETT